MTIISVKSIHFYPFASLEYIYINDILLFLQEMAEIKTQLNNNIKDLMEKIIN